VLGGGPVTVKAQDRSVVVELPDSDAAAPVVVRFAMR
jgi:hypothetical protein